MLENENDDKQVDIKPLESDNRTIAEKEIIPSTKKVKKVKKVKEVKEEKEEKPPKKRGRPRKNPVGPAKAMGEKRVLTKARKEHLEKMRVAKREKAKLNKDVNKTRPVIEAQLPPQEPKPKPRRTLQDILFR
jgi:hypothetical protein